MSLNFTRLGFFLIVVALLLFGVMFYLAPQSNNPVEMMRLSGRWSGTVGGVGVILIVLGLVRRWRG